MEGLLSTGPTPSSSLYKDTLRGRATEHPFYSFAVELDIAPRKETCTFSNVVGVQGDFYFLSKPYIKKVRPFALCHVSAHLTTMGHL